MAYQSNDPSTSKLLQTFAELSDAQLEAAPATASTCFTGWRAPSYAARAAVTARAAAILRERREEFAGSVTLEMGKLITGARGEVDLSADILDCYAQNAERLLAPEVLSPHGGEAHVESSLLGVLFGIESWNFPYCQLARFAPPNLTAGNVVLVKHLVPTIAEARVLSVSVIVSRNNGFRTHATAAL